MEALKLTPLAVQYSSNLEIVKFLLDKGISSINATTNNGWTPLHVAIQGNKLNTVEFLLNRGADIEVRDIYNQTSLDLATRKGYLDIAGILKQVQLGKELLTAVQGVDRNKIRDLIRLGAKLEVKDNSGNTPLCMASLIGKLDIVQYLVSKGANINAKCKAGKTPLDIAAYQKLSDVVEYFKQTQLDLDKELLNAAKSGDLDKVKECIKRGAYIDTKSSNGRTSLHWAAVEGCLPGVEYLIKGVADINAKDNISRTPLHYAARNGHLDVVKYFIEEGADFEVKDKDNKTPLDLASWKKHNDVVKYLEKIKEERYKTVQRKRRHHHGDHARHHMSRRPLAIDSSNQPEIAASSAIKPSSWINDLFNWVKGSVSELLGSRATLPEEISNTVNSIPKVDTQFAKSSGSSNGTLDSKEMPKDKLESGSNSASVKPSVSEDIYDYFASGKFFRDNVDYVNANLKQAHERQMPVKFKPSGENTILEMGDHYLSQADSNGAIMLLDLLVRKVTGQKYVSTVDQPISSLEAQGYTLNIIEKFEKVLNETAIKSGISVTNLNFDPVAVQSAIVGKIRNGEFSQVSKTLYSFAKEVCPEFKQTDKFLAHLRSNLESEKEAILLQQKVEKPSKILDQQVSRKVELSKKPNTFLNGTSVVKGISNVLER